MPESVTELGSREVLYEQSPRQGRGRGEKGSQGLTPEEDEHVGDRGEQGTAQAAAHTHAGAGRFQADHFVHSRHQFRWVFPLQPETGHRAAMAFKSSQEPRNQPHFKAETEKRRSFEASTCL